MAWGHRGAARPGGRVLDALRPPGDDLRKGSKEASAPPWAPSSRRAGPPSRNRPASPAIPLPMELEGIPWIETAARALEVAGVGVILAGVALASALFIRDLVRRTGRRAAYDRYRANLGRGILLGLELLVGADIIATITAPLTFESVGLLAAVVAIRTFVSVSLEMEIGGRWPWRRAEADGGSPER